MLTDLGLVSFATSRTSFTPFFEYSISPFKDEFRLHFRRLPFVKQYKNEIFNRLNTYNGYDIIQYLEYHYARYPEKSAFLNFLKSEINERLSREKKSDRKTKLLTAADWVKGKMIDIPAKMNNSLAKPNDSVKKENQRHVNQVLHNDQRNNINGEALSDKLLDTISPHLEKSFKEQINNLTASIPKSNISLNNKIHEEKLVEFLLLFSQLQYPIKGPKAEKLFSNFTQADIATLLNINFEAFKNKKINTVQKNVGQAQENLHIRNIRRDKLNEALSEYFFSG